MDDNLQCYVCKDEIIKGEIGSIVTSSNGVAIIKCKSCNRKSISFAKLPELMVVPVSPQTMNYIIRNKKYYHPMFYRRKGAVNLAFYVGTPISAITHYAKVSIILKDIELENLMDVSQIKIAYKNKKLDFDNSDRVPKYKVYELENIFKLKVPVKRGDIGPIQNVRITTLDKLRKATQIKEL